MQQLEQTVVLPPRGAAAGHPLAAGRTGLQRATTLLYERHHKQLRGNQRSAHCEGPGLSLQVTAHDGRTNRPRLVPGRAASDPRIQEQPSQWVGGAQVEPRTDSQVGRALAAQPCAVAATIAQEARLRVI